MHSSRQGPREVDVPGRLGGRAVDRSGRRRVVDREQEQVDDVVEVDPAHPLHPRAGRRPCPPLPTGERLPSGRAGPSPRAPPGPGPARRRSGSLPAGTQFGPPARGVFQFAADDRQEVGARRARPRSTLSSPCARNSRSPTPARTRRAHPGGPGGLDQLLGRVHPAVADLGPDRCVQRSAKTLWPARLTTASDAIDLILPGARYAPGCRDDADAPKLRVAARRIGGPRDDDHLVAPRLQSTDQAAADHSRAAGQEDSHRGPPGSENSADQGVILGCRPRSQADRPEASDPRPSLRQTEAPIGKPHAIFAASPRHSRNLISGQLGRSEFRIKGETRLPSRPGMVSC